MPFTHLLLHIFYFWWGIPKFMQNKSD